MAAERLSKLQKWILIQTYKNYDEKGETFYLLKKKRIYEEYFKIKCESTGWSDHYRFIDSPGCKHVILCRSLARLNASGYIRDNHYKEIILTNKGIKKAKELLNI